MIHSLVDLIETFNKKISRDFARIISHLGFGLLVFFIGINHNFSIDKDFNLKEGEKISLEKYIINFNSLNIEERENYKAVVGKFNIIDKKNSSNIKLAPEIRIYSKPETLTYESSIRSRVSYDLYLTMSNIERSDYYNIKFQKKPFMICIWLSAILIACGGFIRLFKNEN